MDMDVIEKEIIVRTKLVEAIEEFGALTNSLYGYNHPYSDAIFDTVKEALLGMEESLELLGQKLMIGAKEIQVLNFCLTKEESMKHNDDDMPGTRITEELKYTLGTYLLGELNRRMVTDEESKNSSTILREYEKLLDLAIEGGTYLESIGHIYSEIPRILKSILRRVCSAVPTHTLSTELTQYGIATVVDDTIMVTQRDIFVNVKTNDSKTSDEWQHVNEIIVQTASRAADNVRKFLVEHIYPMAIEAEKATVQAYTKKYNNKNANV